MTTTPPPGNTQSSGSERPAPTDVFRLLRAALDVVEHRTRSALTLADHAVLSPSAETVLRRVVVGGMPLHSEVLQLGLTKQGGWKIVRNLNAAGYLESTVDPVDRRLRLTRPTDRGRQYVELVDRVHADAQVELFAALGPGQLSPVMAGLARWLEQCRTGPPTGDILDS